MSVKIKSMYCRTCDKKVIAQRNGHAVRTAVTLGVASNYEKWLCPHCAGPASVSETVGEEWLMAALILVAVTVSIVILAAHSPLVTYMGCGMFVVGFFVAVDAQARQKDRARKAKKGMADGSAIDKT